MPRLIHLRRIKAHAQPQRRTSVQLRAVRQRRNTTIIDLGLGKAQRVKLVLGRDLQPTGLLVLHIEASLDAHLDNAVDLLVQARGNDGQVLRPRDRGSVFGGLVPDSEGVASDRSFLQVVARLATDDEALVPGHGVDDSVDVAVFHAVGDEGAGVDVGVLEGEVDLLRHRGCAGGGGDVLELDFGAGGEGVDDLGFGVEEGAGGEVLGEGETCGWVS